ncbi:MAG: hypothetical protein GY839_02870 [candidate division Zixibacteria bacterium]|nr:hypothetical protein [candidate division Zixibacteria bacterium]
MEKISILIIEINRRENFPDPYEIESYFPGTQVVVRDNIQDGIAEICSGKFGVVTMSDNLSSKGQENLEYALHYLSRKPAIIIFKNIDNKSFKLKKSLAKVCYYHSVNDKSKKSILLTIDAALKRHELLMENRKLRQIIGKSKTNQNVIDLTLSYNHEINNLLTLITCQAQLLLQNGDLDETRTKNKLMKIEKNTQKIRKLAIDLTDTINATSDNQSNNITSKL